MIILRNNSYYWHITKCYSGCKTEIRWFKKIIILIDDEKKNPNCDDSNIFYY